MCQKCLETLVGEPSEHAPPGLPDFPILDPLYRLTGGRLLRSGALWIFDPEVIRTGTYDNLYWNLGNSGRGITHRPYAFAADAFGDLYAVHGDIIVKVETETNTAEVVSATVESWAYSVLADPDVELGEDFLRRWESKNGPLPRGQRLYPRIPFIFGGEFDLENVVAASFEEMLRFRAYLVEQTKDLPDGAKVMFHVVD